MNWDGEGQMCGTGKGGMVMIFIGKTGFWAFC